MPVAPLTGWSWTWGDQSLATAATDQGILDELASHLVAMVPDVSPEDLLAVLRDGRGDDSPLYDLAAVLGLPTAAVEMIEAEESELPHRGQLLLPSDKKRHARDLIKAQLAERGATPSGDVDAARVNRKTLGVGGRALGAVFLILGVLTGMAGALCLLLGLRPATSVVGLDHPAQWVVLGMALFWYGRFRLSRGPRRSLDIHEA